MLGWTQNQLAERMEIGVSQVRYLEAGALKNTAEGHILRLCNATGVTLEEFSSLEWLWHQMPERLRGVAARDPRGRKPSR